MRSIVVPIRYAGVIPVGTKMVFSFPMEGVEVGKSMKLEIFVPEVNANIDLERTVTE